MIKYLYAFQIKKKERLALAGVCRFDSKSNELLQVVDLIIGCINYDIKCETKMIPGSKYKLKIVLNSD